jgi:hypothetical protein
MIIEPVALPAEREPELLGQTVVVIGGSAPASAWRGQGVPEPTSS